MKCWKKPSEPVKESVMEIIKNYFEHMDSENVMNIGAEELNYFNKNILKKKSWASDEVKANARM